MRKRIAFIHTTPFVLPAIESALEPLKKDYDFFHMMDEAILYRMMKDGNTPELAEPWLQDLVDKSIRGGADLVIVSCSSLSPYVLSITASVPVLRIDEMMYRTILQKKDHPVVLMTNPTNEIPAAMLAQEMKSRLRLAETVPVRICPGAFEALKSGDSRTHDEAVIREVDRLLDDHDAVIFSQISMARVRALLPENQQNSVFISLDFLPDILAETIS